mgnify:CR=1 FL=1
MNTRHCCEDKPNHWQLVEQGSTKVGYVDSWHPKNHPIALQAKPTSSGRANPRLDVVALECSTPSQQCRPESGGRTNRGATRPRGLAAPKGVPRGRRRRPARAVDGAVGKLLDARQLHPVDDVVGGPRRSRFPLWPGMPGCDEIHESLDPGLISDWHSSCTPSCSRTSRNRPSGS